MYRKIFMHNITSMFSDYRLIHNDYFRRDCRQNSIQGVTFQQQYYFIESIVEYIKRNNVFPYRDREKLCFLCDDYLTNAVVRDAICKEIYSYMQDAYVILFSQITQFHPGVANILLSLIFYDQYNFAQAHEQIHISQKVFGDDHSLLQLVSQIMHKHIEPILVRQAIYAGGVQAQRELSIKK